MIEYRAFKGFIIFVFVAYLIGSFHFGSFNIEVWTGAQRVSVLCFGYLGLIVGFIRTLAHD